MSEPSPELVETIEAQAGQIYSEALAPIAGRFEFEPVPSKSETSCCLKKTRTANIRHRQTKKKSKPSFVKTHPQPISTNMALELQRL